MSETSSNEQLEKITEIIAQFKADLLWDDIAGVFDLVPTPVKQQLENQYLAALKAASEKLNIPLDTFQIQVEDLAYSKVNGLTFSPTDVQNRLKHYGVSKQNETN
jgi:hypothetical protein